MPKKITIDKDGFVVSTGDDSPTPDEIRRCQICREPLDPDKPHECNPATLGKTVFPKKDDQLPAKKPTRKPAIVFDIVCPICQETHPLRSLGAHASHHHRDGYRIMHLIWVQCPFCRDGFSTFDLIGHIYGCKRKPKHGHALLGFKSIMNNRSNRITIDFLNL